jgi:hypothetical protein
MAEMGDDNEERVTLDHCLLLQPLIVAERVPRFTIKLSLCAID